MHGLNHLQRWALFDRDTKRLIKRDASLDKLRSFGGVLARLGVAVDYRREVYLDQSASLDSGAG